MTENLFGVTVTDRYRWMEEPGNAEYASWVKEQSEHTRRTLDSLTGAPRLRAELRAAVGSRDTVRTVRHTSSADFLVRNAGGSSPQLWIRDPHTHHEDLLLASSQDFSFDALNDFFPAPDAKHVIAVVSTGGNEVMTLRVIDVASKALLPEVIDHTRYALVSWLPDSNSFIYTANIPISPPDVHPVVYRGANSRLHRIGDPPANDAVLLGSTKPALFTLAPEDQPSVTVSPNGRFAIATIFHGVARELSLLIKPVADLSAADRPWTVLFEPKDAVLGFSALGDDLYVVQDDSRSPARVAVTTLPDGHLRSVYQPTNEIPQSVFAARDGIYMQSLHDGLQKVRAVISGREIELNLPEGVSVENIDASATANGIVLQEQSYTAPPRWVMWHPGNGTEPEVVAGDDSAGWSDIEVLRRDARSADGTLVPLTIVQRKGAPRDGTNYAWLVGYGAGGYFETPSFDPPKRSWFDRGGIYAVAHIRGGGEGAAVAPRGCQRRQAAFYRGLHRLRRAASHSSILPRRNGWEHMVEALGQS